VEHYLQTISVEEVNQMEPNGFTALHIAAYRGHEKIVELLLQKGACHSSINKYNNNTPLDQAKTDKIKQMIRRRMNKTRFVSDSVEWIRAPEDADFQAHEYLKKLEPYGRDPQFDQLIIYIKQNYLEGDLQHMHNIDKIKQDFDKAVEEKDPIHLLTAYTAETDFYSALNVHLTKLRLDNLTDNENLSQTYYAGIIHHHPTFETFSHTGIVFRGMMFTNNDLKQ
jgi:ankyrin repeat protein